MMSLSMGAPAVPARARCAAAGRMLHALMERGALTVSAVRPWAPADGRTGRRGGAARVALGLAAARVCALLLSVRLCRYAAGGRGARPPSAERQRALASAIYFVLVVTCTADQNVVFYATAKLTPQTSLVLQPSPAGERSNDRSFVNA